jgi:hypothetical protein
MEHRRSPQVRPISTRQPNYSNLLFALVPILVRPKGGGNTLRTLMLDTNQQEPFEIGANLMAILAFPALAEEAAFKKAAEALCAEVLRKTIAAYPDHADDWRAAYPVYSAIDEAECHRRLRTLPRRLRDRMVASRMSLGFLREDISGETVTLPPSMARHSLNELSKLVQPQSGQSDPENVERRAWHDTRPVAHLAAAMQIAARAIVPNQDALGYPLDNPDLHRAVIELAQLHEQMIVSDRRFGAQSEELVRIRMAPEAAN